MTRNARVTHRRHPAVLLAILGVAMAAAVAVGAALLPAEASRLSWLREPTLARRELGRSLDLRRALLRLGILHALPPADASGERYGLAPPAAEDLAAALHLPQGLVTGGVPIVALLVAPGDLDALLANPEGRGVASERPAYLAIVDGGALRFASGVGLRLHGGTRRHNPANRAWRVLLRKRYGATEIPGDLLGPEFAGRSLRRLVLRPDSLVDELGVKHFGNTLALDLMRQAGVAAPATRPAALVVGGWDLGIVAVSEYLDEEMVEGTLGHRDFVLAQTRPNLPTATATPTAPVEHGDPAVYDDFLRWVESPAARRRADVEARVDLDALVAWTTVVGFLGTVDAFQGSLVLDRRDPAARWFWIAWDLDLSFAPAPGTSGPPWETEVLSGYLFGRGNRRVHDPRAALLRGLLVHEPGFREAMAARMLAVLDHRLTPEFLDGRVAAYTAWADRFGIDDRGFVGRYREFFARRPAIFREQLARTLGVPEPVPLRVSARDSVPFSVDGHPQRRESETWHLPGTTVTLAAADGSPRTVIAGQESAITLP